MGLLELLLIGIGLSMDAFAVAVCQGLSMRRFSWRYAGTLAVYFGGFQALMPWTGWILGAAFADRIQNVDHWIAFLLLAWIGCNMIQESVGEEETAAEWDGRIDHRRCLLMAVATSVDALAAGVTFAFLNVSIVPAVTIIGIATFGLSLLGVLAGYIFGARYQKYAKITGGTILLLLGVQILLEHLGYL